MLLVTAATAFELDPFLKACAPGLAVTPLITGIGPVEAAVRLTAFLARSPRSFAAVLNLGIAGAYIREADSAGLLDICLAEEEVLGDLGICHHEAVEPLTGEALEIISTFPLAAPLREQAAQVLQAAGIPFRQGRFVTVQCVSGSRERGNMLVRRHQGLCENMEGAAVARVCLEFGLPLLELRCISNLVEDRDQQRWQLKKACVRSGEVAALVAARLSCPHPTAHSAIHP